MCTKSTLNVSVIQCNSILPYTYRTRPLFRKGTYGGSLHYTVLVIRVCQWANYSRRWTNVCGAPRWPVFATDIAKPLTKHSQLNVMQW